MIRAHLISSQDILLIDEAMAKIRKNAEKSGYTEIRRFSLNQEYDKSSIFESVAGSSLFFSKTLVELNFYSNELTSEQEKLISNLVTNMSTDTLLSFRLPRLPVSVRKKKWMLNLKKMGASLQILYPPEGAQYINWIQERAQQHGVSMEKDAVFFLGKNCEGDLSFVNQELQKLALLYATEGATHTITYKEAVQAISDNSDYAISALGNSALDGDVARCRHILQRLQSEGVAPVRINWSLAHDVRMLIDLSARKNITDRDLLAYSVFGPRKRKVYKAIQRLGNNSTLLFSLLRLCAMTDRAIKGGEGHTWQMLQSIALRIAGQTSPALSFIKIPTDP